MKFGRNSIVVRNVDENSSEFKKMRNAFSLYDKVQHKYTFSAYTIIDSDVYIPATVSVNSISSIFPKKQITKNFISTAKADTISYNLKNQPRNELQIEAIKFLEKMKNDNENRSRFLSLETGSGKTYITINFISKLKKKSLVIVDSIDLANQWKEQFLYHTDLKPDDIVILSGQESVDKESKNPSAKIYIAIHRTLSNMLSEDNNSVNVLMNKLKIGFRVFDESHVEFGNICRINSLSNVEYTLYLTATPNRSRFTDDSLYSKIFGKVLFFNGKLISNEKYHTVVLYKYNTLPGIDDKATVKTQYGFSTPKWANYIVNNAYDIFLEALEDILTKFKLLERDKKIAIMLPTLELIEKIKNDLLENHPDLDIGVFIGSVSKNKRKNELDKKIIITNDKIFEKGIDDQDLEILINFVPFGSIVKTEQIIGRLRNREGKSSILIDCTDYGFIECINQLKLRKRFYKKKAKKIFEDKN